MNQINTTQNPESLNQQTTILNPLRFHWWIVFCCALLEIKSFSASGDTETVLLLVSSVFGIYLIFTVFFEIALYYKENGEWQILPTILMLSPLVTLLPFMILFGEDLGTFIADFPCYIAPFFLKIVEIQKTQKENLSFAKKSGCLWTIIPMAVVFLLMIIMAISYVE